MSLIGRNIGNYKIVAQLGEGGMGTVYLGEHPLIGKKVAVKVLLDELSQRADVVQRFFNEAKAVNDIAHPNIVDIVDFGQQNIDGRERVYFIMEFLDGDSLQGRLRKTGLTIPESLHVISQCCSALSASHKKGIVHRDLKPDNIFLCPRGADRNFVKILDFGIAKLTGDGPGSSSKTKTGLVIGTPWYMSPEQCEGKGLIDPRSDVYSLGVVLYELLTGQVPFGGEAFGEVLLAQMVKPPPPPSQINPNVRGDLETIVLRALAKDRAQRFQTMEEFQDVVDQATGRPVAGQRPRSVSTRQTTLSHAAVEVEAARAAAARRSRSKAPVMALLAVALVGGGGFFARKLFGGGHDKPPAVEAPSPPQAEAARPPAPANDSIEVRILSDPGEAHVMRADGVDLGRTPVTIKAKKGESFDVRLKLDGYRVETKEVLADMNKEIVVAMAREAAPAAAPAAQLDPPSSRAHAQHSELTHSAPSHKPAPSHRPAAPTHNPAAKVEKSDDLIAPPSIFK
jgi:serine/threonine-protein kinase